MTAGFVILVISRNVILNEVWGYDKYPTTRTVDTFVDNLRQNIESNPAQLRHLLTLPWSGCKFHKSQALQVY